MANKQKMMTAIFRDRAAATRAYDWLQDRGYTSSEINVLMSDQTRSAFTTQGTEGKMKSGNMATEGIAAGGAVGTMVGATLAAIAAIGTTIVLPGIGPGVGLVIAGPIVAALAGGGAGAVAGGVVGGLVGLGIPESNAQAYEEALRNGGVAFGVVPRSSEDADAIQEYFEEHEAENVIST